MKTVSVIIPAYNSADIVSEAIESVLAQRIVDLEIIVVDDGSKDPIKEVLSPYIEIGAIRYIYQSNAGPGAARNHGIAEATGQFICFLDADDTLLPGSIAKRAAFLERHPDVGMVFTDLYWCRCKGDLSEIHLRDAAFIDTFAKAVIRADPPNYVFDERYVRLAYEHNPCIKTSTVMVKRSIFESIGLFDETLRAAEDVDLWLRVARRTPIGYIDEPLTCYSRLPSSLTADTERFFKDSLIYYKGQYHSSTTQACEKKALKRKISQLLFAYGYHLLQNKCNKAARSMFIEAMTYNGINTLLMKNISISLLPNILTAVGRRIKDKVRARD